MSADDAHLMGNLCIREGRVEDAIYWYSTALQTDAVNHVLYSNRSEAYLQAGRAKEALIDAETCVHICPSWGSGYIRLARALCLMSRWQSAKDALCLAMDFEKLQTHGKIHDLLRLCNEHIQVSRWQTSLHTAVSSAVEILSHANLKHIKVYLFAAYRWSKSTLPSTELASVISTDLLAGILAVSEQTSEIRELSLRDTVTSLMFLFSGPLACNKQAVLCIGNPQSSQHCPPPAFGSDAEEKYYACMKTMASFAARGDACAATFRLTVVSDHLDSGNFFETDLAYFTVFQLPQIVGESAREMTREVQVVQIKRRQKRALIGTSSSKTSINSERLCDEWDVLYLNSPTAVLRFLSSLEQFLCQCQKKIPTESCEFQECFAEVIPKIIPVNARLRLRIHQQRFTLFSLFTSLRVFGLL